MFTYMSTPAEQCIHHQVPVSKFHLEQFKHVGRNKVFELQCIKVTRCIWAVNPLKNKIKQYFHHTQLYTFLDFYEAVDNFFFSVIKPAKLQSWKQTDR